MIYSLIGYVEEIKKDLFSVTSKLQLKGVTAKYGDMVPPSLRSQFTERINKTEAVKTYKQRQTREVTRLYPSGKKHANFQVTEMSGPMMQYAIYGLSTFCKFVYEGDSKKIMAIFKGTGGWQIKSSDGKSFWLIKMIIVVIIKVTCIVEFL